MQVSDGADSWQHWFRILRPTIGRAPRNALGIVWLLSCIQRDLGQLRLGIKSTHAAWRAFNTTTEFRWLMWGHGSPQWVANSADAKVTFVQVGERYACDGTKETWRRS